MSKPRVGAAAVILLLALCSTWTDAASSLAGNYSFQPLVSTSFGFQWVGYLSPESPVSGNERAIDSLVLNVLELNDHQLHLRLLPGQGEVHQPFRVPPEVFPGIDDVPLSTPDTSRFSVSVVGGEGLTTSSLVIADTASGQRLFQLDSYSEAEYGFTFADKYLTFSIPIPEGAYLYGFGEHNYYYFINQDQYTGAAAETNLSAWNTDTPVPWKDPLYGVHPVIYFSVPSSPLFYAIAIVNTHAQKVRIQQQPGAAGRLVYETVGGILDTYILAGESPLDVVQQYYALIGPAHVPPYWSLGTHQCRWGYQNISVLEGVVAGYKNADLPLEGLWTDINVMDQYRIFTTDPVNFPEPQLAAFISGLHNNSQKYIQIVDPGVAYVPSGNYSIYTDGLMNDVYMKFFNSTSGQNESLINIVWPGQTVFPDFTSPTGNSWWGKQLKAYREKIPIDGVWLDMNEISAFCPGVCAPVSDNIVPSMFSGIEHPGGEHEQRIAPINPKVLATLNAIDYCTPCGPVNSSLNSPSPGENVLGLPDAFGFQQTLPFKTIDMTAQTHFGNYYSTKAFIGWAECNATFHAMLEQTGKRPFLLSRSTFMGSGRLTAHWTGDDHSLWPQKAGGIYDSIQGILASNLFGIPMVGSDIGGFAIGVATEELVLRWTQLGAYYPFMRNHHTHTGPGQEPYRFSPKAVASMRRAMRFRYHLLPYLFSQLMKANVEGAPVLRHLSLQFPFDAATYRDTPNFMFGESILVLPLVAEGMYTVQDQYLPRGPWFDLWSGFPISAGQRRFTSGSNDNQQQDYTDLPVLLRAGSIIPIHTGVFLTIQDTRATGVSLIVALDPSSGAASGECWFDDGQDSPLSSVAGGALHMQYNAQGSLESGRIDGWSTTPTALPPQVGVNPSPSTPSYIAIYIAHDFAPLAGPLPNRTFNDFLVTLNGTTLSKARGDFTVSNASLPFNGLDMRSTAYSGLSTTQGLVLRINLVGSAGHPLADATRPFSIQWWLNGTTAPSANQVTPSQTTSDTASKTAADNRVLVIVVVLLCIALAVALVYAACMSRKARQAQAESDYTWLS